MKSKALFLSILLITGSAYSMQRKPLAPGMLVSLQQTFAWQNENKSACLKQKIDKTTQTDSVICSDALRFILEIIHHGDVVRFISIIPQILQKLASKPATMKHLVHIIHERTIQQRQQEMQAFLEKTYPVLIFIN